MDGITIVAITSLLGLYIIIFFVLYFLFSTDIPIAQFKKALITAIQKETIHSIEDVYHLYYGARNLNNINNNYRQSLNRIIKRLILKKTIEMGKGKRDIEETKQIIKKLKEILADNEKVSPFSELPSQEKALFEDVSNYLRHNDLEAVKNKINEISKLFVIMNEKKIKVDKFATISFILAVISTTIPIYTLF